MQDIKVTQIDDALQVIQEFVLPSDVERQFRLINQD